MLAAACLCAALCGLFSSLALQYGLQGQARHRRARLAAFPREWADGGGGVPAAAGSPVLRAIRRQGRISQPHWLVRLSVLDIWGFGLSDGGRLVARAGLSDEVTLRDVRTARVRMTAMAALVGFLAGEMLSAECGLVFGAAGCVAGFACVPHALRARATQRSVQMEHHLSEMLDVVVLGLQSGLSFERSFGLYPKYFDTELGRSMARVSRQWEMGLVTREEALRQLEAEYDSALLSRVVASMARSLRFGTSITESLASVAVEAREAYRARMEERVAKAGVKMMLPVGTLILPAMLILVLGPVMLELVQGF